MAKYIDIQKDIMAYLGSISYEESRWVELGWSIYFSNNRSHTCVHTEHPDIWMEHKRIQSAVMSLWRHRVRESEDS